MPENQIVHDPSFRDLILPNAGLVKLADGMLWAEGPIYFAQGDCLLWSDIPSNKLYQWVEGRGVRVFDHNANNCNGHAIDDHGRLISCEHLTRTVTRREHDGSVTVIADRHLGRRLNSPNDVVVNSDGSI